MMEKEKKKPQLLKILINAVISSIITSLWNGVAIGNQREKKRGIYIYR
uniref:Uncharacterized protein n=1 Tax=Rhizophora mucronata TaxID=61149 RepID=A0A2P2NY07_RHIMU